MFRPRWKKIEPRWTTEDERQELHRRSLENVRNRRRRERARVLPEEMADLDLDKIPAGAGEKFDCRTEMRRRAHVEEIIAAVHDAWPGVRFDDFSKYLGKRHLREDIDLAWLEYQALETIKPNQPWAARRQKCEAALAALSVVKAKLQDREGKWLAGQSPETADRVARNLEARIFDAPLTILAGIERIEAQVRRVKSAIYNPDQLALDWNGPSLQWLIGERLPLIFDKWFRAKVTVDQSKKVLTSGEDSGKQRRYRHRTPYIAFVTAVLAERGAHISPGMIAKYVRAAKQGTRTA
jgi:hypothetical protein